ncbi:MAG: hypothetical protein GXC73_11445 [Chitinophagaceae bacterium]|nr:hypothetical protein [Chitinophagaceae bacterium]
MNSSYKIVFRIEMLHDYYREAKAKNLQIKPSAATEKLFRNYDIKWKQLDHQLIVAVKTNNAGEPAKQWPDDLRFVFYIVTENGLFDNITHSNYQAGKKETNWLSNFSNNPFSEPVLPSGTINKLYLSKPVAAHVAATIYKPGRLVTDGTDVYECLKTTSNGTLISDSSFWRKRGKRQFVAEQDVAMVHAARYPFTVAVPAKEFVIKHFGIDPQTGLFNKEAKTVIIQKFETVRTMVDVSLQGLDAGKYRIDVNGESSSIVVKDPGLVETPVAVIELHNKVGNAPAFSLLDSGKAVDRMFSLRFCNKSVLVKYIAKTNDVTSVQDSAAALSFSNAVNPLEFISTTPFPLSEVPIRTLSFTSAIHGNISPLPNASASWLSQLQQGSDIYNCSSVYLNH